ncbi:hypothetical protein GJV26_05170 [Massilia dura]|uniref:Uncharacterized protein n=1 Tax=Pseudoduganella dura TaxID=321982 RepID=A0A6I3XGT6_9BURK|nr:hypothetical protein [Pseudoduganella dura]MUI11878.1 hypothetical protein [Pseudoduganella dura]GGY08963.1 hypothetical protein GCM10007386_44340 [Pseudoduganella dura]
MQNDDKQRPDQPPIHTHLPDTVPPEDVKKIVGDAVPHGADYNSPPPEGAGKSMGSGLDDSVGGPGLGASPAQRGEAATTRDQDSRADDRHMGNGQQGNQGSGQQGGGGNAQSGSNGSATPGNAQRDAGSRSEGLLPAGGETDGRFDVAEEVSFDQQSDQARRVGSMEDAAKGPHGDKLADAVARSLGKDGGNKG